jgi:hypothetical protein
VFKLLFLDDCNIERTDQFLHIINSLVCFYERNGYGFHLAFLVAYLDSDGIGLFRNYGSLDAVFDLFGGVEQPYKMAV